VKFTNRQDMEMTGRKELALKAYEDALVYYPQMRRAQERVGELLDAETGSAI